MNLPDDVLYYQDQLNKMLNSSDPVLRGILKLSIKTKDIIEEYSVLVDNLAHMFNISRDDAIYILAVGYDSYTNKHKG
ncbi:hypothetical protein ABEY43_07245 [Priestia megaterium]